MRLHLPRVLGVALPLVGALLTLPTVGRAASDTRTTPAATRATAQLRRVLVLDLRQEGEGEGSGSVARLVRDTVATYLAKQPGVEVLSTEDLRQVLEVEAERAALGCDTTSCLAEIAGALGADLIVHGSVGRLGSSTVVHLNLFDALAGRALGRELVQVERLEEIPPQVQVAANRLAASAGFTRVDGEAQAQSEERSAGPSGGPSTPLLIGGALTAGVGVAALGVLSAVALGFDDALRTPSSTPDAKQAALDWRIPTLAGGAVAAVAVVGGASIAGAAFFVE